jgi:hypothetical protein
MIVKYLSSFIVIIFLIFFGACEYPLNEEYKSPVKPTDPSTLEVSLNPEQPSYVLTGTSKFNCKALTKGLKIYKIKVFVDSVEIYSYDDVDPNSFSLYCKDYSEGIHELTVLISTNSNSGSIADITGLEGFVLAGTWELKVDKSPPTAVQITRIFNDGGILKIEWGKYSKNNFARYTIVRSYRNLPDGSLNTEAIGYVYDSLQTFFYDSTYVGGRSEYQVVVITPIDLKAWSEPKAYDDPAPNFKVEWIEEDIMKLSWDKCNYPKAFRQYRLSLDYDTVITVNDVNTNSITGHFGVVGKNRYFQLEVLTKKQYELTGVLISRIEKGVGIPFMKFDQLLKNSVNDDLIISSPQKLYRFDPISGKFIDSIAHPDTYRQSNYMLSPANDLLLLPDPPVKSINPVTFKVTDIPVYSVFSKNLSNTSYGLASASAGLALYDFKNLKTVSSLPNLNWNGKYLSGDNKYLFEYDEIAHILKCSQITNDGLTPVWTTPALSYHIIPENPGIVMVCTENEFKVINISPNGTILSIPLISGWTSILDVDPDTKIVVLYGSDILSLYNYQTGLKVRSFHASYTNTYYLKSSTLYSPTGFKLPLALKKK